MNSPFISILVNTILDIWTKPVLRLKIEDGKPSVELFPHTSPVVSIDERIQRIDAARQNLAEALDAMDELKIAAEQNKAELATAIERLDAARQERASAEKELQGVREIAQSDIEVFKKLAGVPSKLEIAKERLLGFLFGVLASVVASMIWWGLTKFLPYFN
jgi:hypothetical protein